MEDTVGGLGVRLGRIQLIHFLVVALLQIDDLPLAGPADQDHREAVDGRVGQRDQAVQEARRGHGQANAGLLGHVAGDCGCIARMLFMPEADEAHPLGLSQASQVRDGNAHQPKDGVDIVEFQGVDDEMKPVGQFA